MTESVESQEINRCAYCLKPVTDHFVCDECIRTRQLTVEAVDNANPRRLDVSKAQESEKLKEEVLSAILHKPFDRRNLKKIPLHPDLKRVGSKAFVVTMLALIPVSAVGFALATFFGMPVLLALTLSVAFCIGWLAYRSQQIEWYHYATWVFNRGFLLRCEIDLISSGELDQPFIKIRNENLMTTLYKSRVFKVVFGEPSKILDEAHLAGSKTSFDATAIFDREVNGDAVIFEVNQHRLWCKPYLSRGI